MYQTAQNTFLSNVHVYIMHTTLENDKQQGILQHFGIFNFLFVLQSDDFEECLLLFIKMIIGTKYA